MYLNSRVHILKGIIMGIHSDKLEAKDKFQEQAKLTKFAIETEHGFWNREVGSYFPTVENATCFNWLEQADYLTEAMEEISLQGNGWFTIICVEPFKE